MLFGLHSFETARPIFEGRQQCWINSKRNGWIGMQPPLEHTVRSAKRTRPAAGNNLGALESLVGDPVVLDDEAQSYWQALSDASSLDLGPKVDGGAAFASIILLVLLLALSSNRILGLEQRFGQWLRYMAEQKRYRDRNQTIAAREQLERQYGQDKGGGGGKE